MKKSSKKRKKNVKKRKKTMYKPIEIGYIIY